MTHFLVSEIEWDCDDYDPQIDCGLPATVLVINGPEKESTNYADFVDRVGREITEAFGFRHSDFKIEPCDLNGVYNGKIRRAGLNWADGVINSPGP